MEEPLTGRAHGLLLVLERYRGTGIKAKLTILANAGIDVGVIVLQEIAAARRFSFA